MMIAPAPSTRIAAQSSSLPALNAYLRTLLDDLIWVVVAIPATS